MEHLGRDGRVSEAAAVYPRAQDQYLRAKAFLERMLEPVATTAELVPAIPLAVSTGPCPDRRCHCANRSVDPA